MARTPGRAQPRQGRPDEGAAADAGEARREFEAAMTDVVPLRPDPRGRVRPRVPLAPRARPLRAVPREVRDVDAARDDAFAAPGVNRREIRRLTRGDHTAERRIDLHGQTAEDASRLLRSFIERCRHDRVRCVCVIHGRGLHSAGGVPVLKISVRSLLREMPEVLAYATAPAAAGGAGAVLVLLRR